MNDKRRVWPRALLLLCVSAGLLSYVLSRVDLSQVGQIFANANWPLAAATIVFSLSAFTLLPTYRWKSTLVAMGFNISFTQLLFARFGSQPLKFSLPVKGGEAFRALYIRRRHGVPIALAGGSIVFDMFLVAVGQLTFLCIGIAVKGGELSHVLLPTVAVFIVGLTLTSKAIQRLMVSFTKRISTRIGDKVEQVAHGFLQFPLGVKFRLTAISYAVEFSEIFSMYLCCKSLGLDIPIWAILIYMLIVMGFTLIPVTISGLGTRELAIFLLFQGMASAEQLASAALMFTFVEFILPALVGCAVLSPFLNALSREPVPVTESLSLEQKARFPHMEEGPSS
ncbi:MAG TPA: flippase-like domain-containing protein [Myxococcales bacterium]|nr:flippase-like domain-containing protein [Myxococcales bacterium]